MEVLIFAFLPLILPSLVIVWEIWFRVKKIDSSIKSLEIRMAMLEAHINALLAREKDS
jgi:hypothetical protein